jgi:hypothetical protein
MLMSERYSSEPKKIPKQLIMNVFRTSEESFSSYSMRLSEMEVRPIDIERRSGIQIHLMGS